MENGIMIQFFHSYTQEDGALWTYLSDEAPKLARLGISTVWLSPACKGAEGTKSGGAIGGMTEFFLMQYKILTEVPKG